MCKYRYYYIIIIAKGHSRGGGWGGVLHQIFGNQVLHTIKNWTQSDLRFCKNEGSKRSKFNKNGDQLDQKSWRKLIQNALETVK